MKAHLLFGLSCLAIFTLGSNINAQQGNETQTIDLDSVNAVILYPYKIIGAGEKPEISFYENSAIDVDEKGQIYICDTGNQRIIILDSFGNFVKEFGRQGKGPGEFLKPEDISITKKRIYISDFGNSRIHVFDRDLKYYSSIPLRAASHTVCADDFGNIYVNSVSYSDKKIIQIFDSEKPHKYKRSFLECKNPPPEELRSFITINQVVFDSDAKGYLHVAFLHFPILVSFNLLADKVSETTFVGEKVKKFKKPIGETVTTGQSIAKKIFINDICTDENNNIFILMHPEILFIKNNFKKIALLRPYKIKESNLSNNKIWYGAYRSINVYKNNLYVTDFMDYTLKLYQLPSNLK